MIDPIFHSDNYQLARKLLDAAVLRQEAVATNVANAETPGFRRLDVAPDFAVQLKSQTRFARSSPKTRSRAASGPMATRSRSSASS